MTTAKRRKARKPKPPAPGLDELLEKGAGEVPDPTEGDNGEFDAENGERHDAAAPVQRPPPDGTVHNATPVAVQLRSTLKPAVAQGLPCAITPTPGKPK